MNNNEDDYFTKYVDNNIFNNNNKPNNSIFSIIGKFLIGLLVVFIIFSGYFMLFRTSKPDSESEEEVVERHTGSSITEKKVEKKTTKKEEKKTEEKKKESKTESKSGTTETEGGTTEDDPGKEPVSPKKTTKKYINVKSTSVVMLVNKEYSLNTDSNCSSIKYSNYDRNIIFVDNNGNIKSLNPGVTEITITGDDITVKVKVQVNYSSTNSIYKDGTMKLVEDSIASNIKSVDYDKTYFKVESNKLTGLKECSNKTVKVTLKNGVTYTYTISVNSFKVQDLKLNYNSIDIIVGNSINISVTEKVPSNSVCNYSFSMSNDVASITSGGNLTANKAGSGNVIVKCENFEKKIPITVRNKVVATSLSTSDPNLMATLSGSYKVLFMYAGFSYNLNYTVGPSDTADKTVLVTSGDPSVVSSSGTTLTALKAGSSYVTVKSQSNSNLSEVFRVIVMPASLATATTYTSYKAVKTLSFSSSNCAFKIGDDDTASVTQSFDIAGNYYLINRVNSAETKGRIYVYNKSTNKKVTAFTTATLQHANGSLYNPINRYHYVGMGDAMGIRRFNTASLTSSLPDLGKSFTNLKVSRLAYDRGLNLMYFGLTGEKTIAIFDESDRELYRVSRKIRGTNQDFFAYNGVLYAIHYDSDLSYKTGKNTVDMYRIMDAAYLGSIVLSYDEEIQSIDLFDDNTVALLFYLDHESACVIKSNQFILYK